MAVSDLFAKKLTLAEQQAKRDEESRARQETERRWYAALPTRVILSLCSTIAVLTYLLSVAPQAKQRPSAPQTTEEKPPPVKPTASPAPTPAPNASQPVSIKMNLNSKELFGFNSNALRVVAGSARRELDACLQPNLTRISVVGHADCIGSDKYNQSLSQRRADAVKRYLTEKGIDAELIAAEGHGATLAKSAAPICVSVVRSTAANVALLEEFRRVDVTCEYAKQVIQA